MLPIISFDAIPEYINIMDIKNETDLKPNYDYILTVYHFIVGSYMFENDIKHFDIRYQRNHEFPQIVKNLFNNPTIQFSPELNEYFARFENVLIQQVIFLIDPMYSVKTELAGFKTVMPELLPKYTFENVINHNEYKQTKYTTTLEPIIIPSIVSEKEIIHLTSELFIYKNANEYVINIMDCTSHTLMDLHINNDNPQIYLAYPDCLLIDTTTQYLPIITLDTNNSTDADISPDEDKLIRWANYNLDNKLIPDLKKVADYCKSSLNLYNFLINDFKNRAIEIELLTIYKMIGLFTVSKEYILLNGRKFTFKDMTLSAFMELWFSSREFQGIFQSSFDTYFRHNIIKFINNFMEKYSMPENTVGIMNSFTMTDAIKKDVWDILVKLNEYFPDDINRVIPPEHYSEVDRLKIRDYIEFNGVHL